MSKAHEKALPLLIGAGALLLTVTTIVVISRLRHSADESRTVQIRLATLETRVNTVSAREWQLIAEQRFSPTVAGELEEALDQAAALAGELSGAEAPPVAVLFNEYRRAVEAELELIKAGDIAAAVEIDEQAVDPAFARLMEAIGRATASRGQKASDDSRKTEIYSALVLASASLVGTLLFAGLHRARSHLRELREAEQMLRLSEQRYRDLFEEARELIFVVDLDGRIVDVNRAAWEWYGGTSADLLGRHLRDTLVPPEDGEAAPPKRTDLDHAIDHEVKLRRMDGTIRDGLWTSNVHRDGSGRATGSQVLIHDVTDRNLLLRQFLESQKMEIVGRLAGGIAHDFNNLLTAILGFSELVAGDLPKDDPHRADLEQVLHAGRSAASLTQQLLAFSRRQILQPAITDINAVVAGCCKMLKRVIGEDVNLMLSLAPSVKAVKLDRGQFEQVLMNLAINARDAMPDGGTLTIESADVFLDEECPRTHGPIVAGPHVMVSVSDTGVGMTPEVQAHVFEPFFTTKETGKGTGLGLATVYGIVKQCQGSIFVYSEPGQGSAFKIYFPAVQEPAEPDDRISQDGRGSLEGHERILVVEDHAGLRSLAQRTLVRHGYDVLTAENGDEALRLSEEDRRHIDLLLTDVVMPGMNGPALAVRLRGVRPTMKVLYMSGYTDQAVVHHDVLDAGAFLQKPFTPESLARRVRAFLDLPERRVGETAEA